MIKYITMAFLQAIGMLLSPFTILAVVCAYQARPAVLANKISPDTYLICAVLFMVGWWLEVQQKTPQDRRG